jgi:hypothetical protein
VQNGFLASGPDVNVGAGELSKIKDAKARQGADDANYSTGDPAAASNIRQHENSKVEVLEEKAEEEQYQEQGGPDDDDDFAKRVLAALEKGCKDLGYTPEFIRDMLRSEEAYTKELLDKIKGETGCSDEAKIR